jgi:pSer/pThr/pTyr-binding forkhead associated (FHA) protein
VVVRDLNSTNGTYIGGEKVTETRLKPGQILRLGQIDMRLEGDEAKASGKKHFDRTTVIAGGIKRSELDHAPGSGGFDTKSLGFSKKDNRVNQIFIVVGVVLGLVILALLIYIAATIRK